MRRLLIFMRWITAMAVISGIMLIAWHCVDIYVNGRAAELQNTQSGDMYSVFRWDDVGARLSSISIPLLLCAAVCAVTWLLHLFLPADVQDVHILRRHDVSTQKEYASMLPAGRRLDGMRMAILIIAAVFILLGVINGGLRDVLIKAINICTECIGLG